MIESEKQQNVVAVCTPTGGFFDFLHTRTSIEWLSTIVICVTGGDGEPKLFVGDWIPATSDHKYSSRGSFGTQSELSYSCNLIVK